VNCIEKLLGKAASFFRGKVQASCSFGNTINVHVIGSLDSWNIFYLFILPNVWARQPGTYKNADSPSHNLLYIFCGIKGESYNGQGRKRKQKEEGESETVKIIVLDKTSMPADHCVLDQNVPAGC